MQLKTNQLCELLENVYVNIEGNRTSPYQYQGNHPFWSFVALEEHNIDTEIGEITRAITLRETHCALDCRGLLMEVYEHSIRGKVFRWCSQKMEAYSALGHRTTIIRVSINTKHIDTAVSLLNRLENKYGLENTILKEINNRMYLLVPAFWADKSIMLSLLLLSIRAARVHLYYTLSKPDEDIEQYLFRTKSGNTDDRDLETMKRCLGMEPLSFFVENKKTIFEGHGIQVPLEYPGVNPMAAHDGGPANLVKFANYGLSYSSKHGNDTRLLIELARQRAASETGTDRGCVLMLRPIENLLKLMIDKEKAA